MGKVCYEQGRLKVLKYDDSYYREFDGVIYYELELIRELAFEDGYMVELKGESKLLLVNKEKGNLRYVKYISLITGLVHSKIIQGNGVG